MNNNVIDLLNNLEFLVTNKIKEFNEKEIEEQFTNLRLACIRLESTLQIQEIHINAIQEKLNKLKDLTEKRLLL